MSLVRHSAWAAAAAITLTGARFALAAIVARRLSQEGFGQFAYAQWLVDLAFLVCSLGATGVASRYAAEYRTRPELLTALLLRWRTYAAGAPVLAGGAVLLGTALSGLHPGGAALAMLALWAVANGLWAMQTALLTGLQRFDLIFRANLLASAIILAGALLLPLHGDDLALLFGAMAVAYGSAAMVGFTATRPLFYSSVRPIAGQDWRAVRTYACNIWLTALLWSLVWSRGEIPIVRAYLGDVGVAQYAAALTILGGAIQGVNLAMSGVAPHLTVLWGNGKRDEAIATARAVMDIQLLLCGAGALFLICVGPELMSVAFGSAYRAASAPLAIFGIGLVAMAVSSQNHLLQIATDARFNRNTMLLGLVVLLGAAAGLMPAFGLLGAAAARAGSMLLLAIVSVIVTTRSWGPVAITRRNVLIVIAVILGVAAAILSNVIAASLERVVLLVCALGLIALTVHNSQGKLVSLALPRFLWARANASRIGRTSGTR